MDRSSLRRCRAAALPLALAAALAAAAARASEPAAEPDWIGLHEAANQLYVAAALPEPDAPDRAAALLAAARAALAPWTNATVRLYEIPGEGAVAIAAPFAKGYYPDFREDSEPAERALLRATRRTAFPTPPGGARPAVTRGLLPFESREEGTNWVSRVRWPTEAEARPILADARGAQAEIWHAEGAGGKPHAESAKSAEFAKAGGGSGEAQPPPVECHAEGAESAECPLLCLAVPCLPEELVETIEELVAAPLADFASRLAPTAAREPFGVPVCASFGDRGAVVLAPLAPGADTNEVLRAVRAKAFELGETFPRFAGDPFVAVRAFAPPPGADPGLFARDFARELLAEAAIADRALFQPIDAFGRAMHRDARRKDRLATPDLDPWAWRRRDALRAEVVPRTGLAAALDPFAEPVEAELVPGDAFRLLLPAGDAEGDFTLRLSPEHAPAGDGLALAAVAAFGKGRSDQAGRIVLCDPSSPTGALRTALFPSEPAGSSFLALVWSPRPDAPFTVYGACPDAPTPQARRDRMGPRLASPDPPRVDLARLYGAGLSRGAGELVCIQQEVPGVFAAVATTDTAIWHTDRIPEGAPLHIWHFYRTADWEKWHHDVRWLRRYADRLPSQGGEMRVTELSDTSRASWDQAWDCDEMWDWMFAQRRPLPLPDWNAPRDPDHPMWRVRAERIAEASEDGPMEWTQWPVPWPADETQFHRLRTERRRTSPDRTADWKAWLAERGVRFPAGSCIRHLPFSSDLLVYGTPADQSRIRALLTDLKTNPFDSEPPPSEPR